MHLNHNFYVVLGKQFRIENDKDIALVTRVRILCTVLFTNNNIKEGEKERERERGRERERESEKERETEREKRREI